MSTRPKASIVLGDAGFGLRLVGDIDGDTDCTLGTAELGGNRIGPLLV